MEESEEFFEFEDLLGESILISRICRIANRIYELLIALYFDHQGRQLQIEQQDVFLALYGSQHLLG